MNEVDGREWAGHAGAVSIADRDVPVAEAWLRIVNWCAEHAPVTAATLRPPAGDEAITAAEQATGRVWPRELKAWYRLHDGVSGNMTGSFLPFHYPLPLAEIVDAWRMRVDIWAEVTGQDERDLVHQMAAPAGTSAGTYLPCYVPFSSDGTGCALVLDARGGRFGGPVILFDKVDSDLHGPTWPSLTAMLQDIADALEKGRSTGGWIASVVGGALDWEPTDDR